MIGEFAPDRCVALELRRFDCKNSFEQCFITTFYAYFKFKSAFLNVFDLTRTVVLRLFLYYIKDRSVLNI